MSITSTGRSSGKAARGRTAQQRSPWRYGLLGGVAAALVVVVALALSGVFSPARPVSENALTSGRWLTTIPIQKGGTVPDWPLRLSPSLAVPGMPTVLYIGADWCPYCAAERWPLAIALSRFGRFTRLDTNRSSSTDVYPDTPTWSFYGDRYQSAVIRVVTFETATRLGPTHPLQPVTEPYLGVFERLDAPPRVPAGYNLSIPFVLVGGRFLWIGTSYSPAVLQGQTWSSIIPSIRRNEIPMGPPINANANVLTAAICAVDGGRPGSVCRNPAIAPLIAHLNHLPYAP